MRKCKGTNAQRCEREKTLEREKALRREREDADSPTGQSVVVWMYKSKEVQKFEDIDCEDRGGTEGRGH